MRMSAFGTPMLPWLLALVLAPTARAACTELTDHRIERLGGAGVLHLCEAFPDQVLLVVNTASRCGFTPQFDGLQRLYERYGDRGLVVLGVPSDDFRQELDREADIAEFCRVNYGVEFPMARKQHVRGAGAHPFFLALTEASGEAPGWNFHKYLVGRDGRLLRTFGSAVPPDAPDLVRAVEEALGGSD